MNCIYLLKTEVYAAFAASTLFINVFSYQMIFKIIGKAPKPNLVFQFSPSCNTVPVLTCVNGSGAEESSQHTAKLKLFIFCYTYKVGFVPPLCLGCKLKMRCVPWQRYDVYEYLCYFINIILPACATVRTPLLYGSPCIFHSTQWHIYYYYYYYTYGALLSVFR